MTVTIADTTIEPRHPRRLGKNRNISANSFLVIARIHFIWILIFSPENLVAPGWLRVPGGVADASRVRASDREYGQLGRADGVFRINGFGVADRAQCRRGNHAARPESFTKRQTQPHADIGAEVIRFAIHELVLRDGYSRHCARLPAWGE
jgi:hypothetical protein